MRGRFNGRVVGQDYTGRNTRHNGRAGMYNAVQSALAPSLDITLANGLGPLFTFTRATTATVKDFEGLIKSCLSGELRIQGARRVENKLTASTAVLTAAGGWTLGASLTSVVGATDPDGGTTAYTVTTSSSTQNMYSDGGTGPTGNVVKGSLWVKRISGSGTVNLQAGSTKTNITSQLTTSWKRFAFAGTTGGFSYDYRLLIEIITSGDSIAIWHPQIEDVTGQTIQTPSEYVSKGVLSSPYHGYFVDGVKYFSYENGNTVASNVVTEAQGAAITGTIGYLAEGARTNLQKQNRTLTTAPWTNQGTPAATQNATGIDGATTAWTLTDNDAGAIEYIYCGAAELALSGSTQYTYSIFVGKQGSAPSGYPCISVDNGTYLAGCTIDPYSGTATVWTAYTGFTVLTSSATCTSWNSNFWRVELTFTTHSSMTTGTVTIIPAGRTTANSATGTNAVAATGSTIFDAPQIEAGAFASSPIITTTAAVARNADVLTCPGAGIVDVTSGSCYAEATLVSASASTNPGLVSMGAGNGNLAYVQTSSGKFGVFDGTNQVVFGSAPTYPITTPVKVATSWGGSTMGGSLSGSAVTSGSFDGSLGGTTISIGLNNGANDWFGVISKVRIYKQKLSDAQLIAMTS